MLRELDIRDILIIDRLELLFQPGLNVLTGETGAGKSILLDSLGFVLGWRGRADLVRQGAERGEVTALFDIGDDHPAQAVLAEAGLPGGRELLLRRTNSPDGRKAAWVNDRRCSGDVLRALSGTLVELHGQHDDRGLLDPRGHRALLDDFGGHGALQAAVAGAWKALAAARKEEATARARLDAARAEEDTLRHAVKELDDLDPQPGEDAELDTRRRLMQGAEKVRDDVQRAAQVLGGEGAESNLAGAIRWLEGAGELLEDKIQEPLAALDRAMTELAEAQAGVEACLDALTFDPMELEQAEERLFALRGLARKHGVLPDELAELAGDLRTRLKAIDHGAEHIAGLEAAVIAAQADYDTAAEALQRARQAAARRLDAAMAAELAPLKMERAEFTTEVLPATPGPDGIDAVQFTVATNPGAPSGPLDKIASGGELSRFLLALKVCLTAGDTGLTLIFDEIDRGVGGATADAVGRRLAALAARAEGQVLVVTHSPQVAALGQHHWRVEKAVSEGRTLSNVVPLDPDARVDEIARMLAGDQITDHARSAARALLAG
ncbi:MULTISPECIES: DNA repair protein RecN [unclassified Meridianimarinicoccus]|uniref:DNA repair protein RecN n=1 Tax=unclassified Meridianimarinicoccus TaxID=2923344 RepID=UPI0018663539|nr:DNA repair protein RecN [Fluviibacterium sp. MJW13]